LQKLPFPRASTQTIQLSNRPSDLPLVADDARPAEHRQLYRVPSKAPKTRADQLLVDRGLCESRTRARALILAGRVFRGEQRVEKPGALLAADAALSVRGTPRYVSRGGDKLEGALAALDVDVKGAVCLDVGASTGGFTDCLLQHGAVKVYAVDVGHGQLAASLRSDSRVVVMERTNARDLRSDMFSEAIDVVVVDASFIGLEKLLPAIRGVLLPGARLLALIKPQFEVGREEARRARGVIRDPEVRAAAIERTANGITAFGFAVLGGSDSRLPGPKGNVEYFVLASYAPA
jgi:23S rRNA (cytidine1920-2'-O)/16S rRNA (cytidine1409-2'-O)-methyltransferase